MLGIMRLDRKKIKWISGRIKVMNEIWSIWCKSGDGTATCPEEQTFDRVETKGYLEITKKDLRKD